MMFYCFSHRSQSRSFALFNTIASIVVNVDRPQDLFFATFSKMKAFYDFCNMFLKGSLKMEARFKSVEANVIAGL